MTPDGKPTQDFITEVNRLRITATMPWLNANVAVTDESGRPTRYLMQTFSKLLGKVPNANVPIVDKDRCPSRSFLLLVRT